MNLIIMVYENPYGVITTRVKWGFFKFSWFGESSIFWALRFCSNWLKVAKKTKIIYKSDADATKGQTIKPI